MKAEEANRSRSSRKALVHDSILRHVSRWLRRSEAKRRGYQSDCVGDFWCGQATNPNGVQTVSLTSPAGKNHNPFTNRATNAPSTLSTKGHSARSRSNLKPAFSLRNWLMTSPFSSGSRLHVL